MSIEIYNVERAEVTYCGVDMVVEGSFTMREKKPKYKWTTYIVTPHHEMLSLKFRHYRDRYGEDSVTYSDSQDKSFVVRDIVRYKLISLEQAKKISFDPTDCFEVSEMNRDDLKTLALSI